MTQLRSVTRQMGSHSVLPATRHKWTRGYAPRLQYDCNARFKFICRGAHRILSLASFYLTVQAQ